MEEAESLREVKMPGASGNLRAKDSDTLFSACRPRVGTDVLPPPPRTSPCITIITDASLYLRGRTDSHSVLKKARCVSGFESIEAEREMSSLPVWISEVFVVSPVFRVARSASAVAFDCSHISIHASRVTWLVALAVICPWTKGNIAIRKRTPAGIS